MKNELRGFVESGAGDCSVLVFGDAMLDKYYYGEVTRISPEAPVPITRVLRSKETLGGAANVAHNLALLGSRVTIAGCVGRDFHGDSLTALIKARGIDSSGLIRADVPTTTKLRVIGGHQQMMRLDFEETGELSGEGAKELIARAEAAMPRERGAVIVSDYGKGVCSPSLLARVKDAAKRAGVPVVIDPKGADWEKYAGADYITPNLKELNEVLPRPIKNEDAAVESAARDVIERFSLTGLTVTRSERGLSLVTREGATHIGAKAREVFDVSGAGDTVIAVFALALAGGLSPSDGAYLANLAAGVVVAKLGTYAVSREELGEALSSESET